jgi:hypothetical protein
MAENFDPITGLEGADNMGGFKDYILFYPKRHFSEVPKLPAVKATDADYVTAAGAFVPKTVGAKPIYIECTPASVKYSAPSQGEVEGQSFAQAGECYRSGDKKSYAALARKYNNEPGYVVIENMDDAQLMIGQKNVEANLKFEYEGGQKRADKRGYKISFAADSVAPEIYLGTPVNIDDLLAES